jgi:hypothetical protein
MVCLTNISVDTLHKGETEEDDDDDDDDDNNNKFSNSTHCNTAQNWAQVWLCTYPGGI